MLGRVEKILGGAGEVSGRVEEYRQLRRRAPRLLRLMRDQRARDLAAERGPPRRLQRRVEDVLVQDVDEPVAHRQRAVGQLFVVYLADERVDAIERVEGLLGIRGIEADRLGDDRGVEFVALHARRDQELPVSVVEALDLALDGRPHRLGHLAFDLRDRASRHPTAVRSRDGATIPQVAQQVHHEERTALRLCVDQADQLDRKGVFGKLEREIAFDVRPGQELERQLAQHASGLAGRRGCGGTDGG